MSVGSLSLRDRWRHATEQSWPALLVCAACCGLGLANWVSIGWQPALAVVALALVGVCVIGGIARVVAVGVVLLALGLWWGSLRMQALGQSFLVREIGDSGRAQLVTTGPARRTSWAIRVPAETRLFGGHPIRERVLLTLPVGRSPPRGAVVEADVRIVEPRPPANGFDERAWLRRQGTHVVLRARTWQQVGRRGGIAGYGDRLRDRVEIAVGRGTTGRRRAVVLGVVLGEDEGLSAHTRDDFRASGLYHLLAVSGQNVAFLAGGMLGLGWLLKLSRTARELLTLAALAAYLLAVGWQPSVVRAGVAGALASLAWLASRPRDRWHFLAVGALVLLAWTPTSLLEPGFQLSFAAVAAIFVGLPFTRRVAGRYPIPPRLGDALGVALACGVATAPIVLVQFGQAPLYTVLANVLAEPAVPLVLGLGLLAAAVDPVAPDGAAALAWLAGWAAAWLELVARMVASLPAAQVGARAAVALALGVTAVCLAARSSRVQHVRTDLALVAAVGALAVAGIGWWSFRPGPSWQAPAGLRITFLDVGQGDAVLLETPSGRVLVDEGPPEADVAGQLVRMGVRSLSALVLTHPERDHVGGAADVLRRLRVGSVLDPELAATGPEYEEALAVIRDRRVPLRLARAGAEFRVGGLVLRVLAPLDAGLPSENPNMNAVVLVASYGELDVFLPADAESDVTRRLRGLPDVEILKVAHHGSGDPGLADELRILRPEIAVVSVGSGNDYGHPRPETLAALASVPELRLYRTDVDGRVVIESDGRSLRVRARG